MTLTANAAVSNSGSTPLDSISGPITLNANITGIGQDGITRQSNVAGNVVLATQYTPLFYRIVTTNSNADPGFTTADLHYDSEFTLGQGATTPGNVTQWLWMAVPGAQPQFPTLRFKFDFGPFIGVDTSPIEQYSNVDVDGQNYTVYGFTNFNAPTFIYTSNVPL